MRSKNNQLPGLNKNFSPDVWFADNYYILTEMVKSGFGWALLPEHLAKSRNLVPVSINMENTHLSCYTNIDVIQHQLWSLNPLHQQLRSLLEYYLTN